MTSRFGGHLGFLVGGVGGGRSDGLFLPKLTLFKTIANARREARSPWWGNGLVFSLNFDRLEIVPDETLAPDLYHEQLLQLAEREMILATERYQELLKGPIDRPEFRTKRRAPRRRRLIVEQDE